ncbi:MAG: PAS domain S-box protein [Cyanothece sp. SIO2G6]|nr:PAS domain S-box protein [Cyanothece sp. SIO2G6]
MNNADVSSSPAFFAALVDSCNDAIITYDDSGIVTSWNQAATTLFGHTKADAVGQTLTQLFPLDTGGVFPQCQWLGDVPSQRVDRMETIRHHQDGTTVEVAISFSPIQTESGEVIGFSEIIRDITPSQPQQDGGDRQSLALELRPGETRTLSILAAMPDLIFQVGADGTYRQVVNAQYPFCLAPADNQFVGRTLWDILPEAIADQKFQAIQQALATGQVQQHEHQLEVNGCLQHEEVRAVPAGEDEVLLLIRDISDRKRVERERLQLQQALLQSRRQLREVLDSAIAGIIRLRLYTDLSMIYDYISPHCEGNFGYTAKELITKPKLWRSRIHPDDWERILLPELHQITTHHTTSIHQFEYRFYRKDGSLGWILANCFSRWDETKQCWLVTVVDTDITARREAEAALAQSQAYNHSILSAIPDLLYVVGTDGTYRKLIQAQNDIDAITTANPVGKSIYELLPIEVAARHMAAIQRTMDSGEPQIYEQQIWVNDRLQDEEVRLVRCGEDEVLLMVRDIGDRKRLENELKRSEAQNRAMLTAIPDLMYRVNRDGVYLSYFPDPTVINFLPTVDPVDRHLLDYAPGAAVDFDTFMELRRYQLDKVITALETGVLQVYENTFETQDQQRWEEVRVIPCGADEVLCIIRDITDRKRAELTLQNLFEATAATTGSNFFPALVTHISQALEVTYVLVTQKVADQLESLAFYAHGELQDSFIYPITATPCEQSLQEGHCCVSNQVQQVFPHDPDLVDLQAKSYVGVALYDQSGNAIGNLCIMDSKPMTEIHQKKQILQILAARAAAELERQQTTQQLEQLNRELETTVAKRTAALQVSEAQIRSIVEAIPDLLVRVARDGTCLSSIHSTHTKNLFVPIHRHLNEILPPDLLQKQLTAIDRALTTQTLQIYEHQFIKGDHMAHEEVRISALGTDEALLIIRDISDRKQAEATLRKSEATNRALLEAIPDFMVRMTSDGIQTKVMNTGAICCLLTPSSDLESIQGASIFDILPLAIAQERTHLAHRALQNGDIQRQEYSFESNGQIFYEEARITPLWDDEVLVLVRDITEQKQADLQIRQSEQFLQTVLDTFPLTVFWKDRDSRYLGCNQNFLKSAGFISVSDVVGKTDYDMPWTEAEATTFRTDDHYVITTETAKLGFIEPLTRSDGHQIWSETYKIPLRDVEGNVIGILGTYQDITARKQAEEQLQKTNAELARATQLKDEFLANMSHELRTPLNAILGMTEAFQEGILGDINEKQLRALQTIERSSTHLLELINDILDMSKIGSGQMTLDRSMVAVAPLCRSSLMFVQQQAIKKQIQLKVNLPLDLPDLFIDERRIRQVLINLLNNAVKFTPNGGQITLEAHIGQNAEQEKTEDRRPKTEESPNPETQFTIAPSETRRKQPATRNPQPAPTPPLPNSSTPPLPNSPPPQSYLQISITDTGIGIAPGDMDKLFQPFVQIDSAFNRQYAGTGLGLALVKRLMELHDGRVRVHSEVGVGSCFTIELPYILVQSLDTLPGTQKQLGVASASTAPSEAALILLAEDNEANILTISNYLLAKGYQLVTAHNGKDAIALAQQKHPALILMDIQMPEMDGIEAIKHIRGYPALATIPIIALTALAMEGDRDRCLTTGANDY